MRIGVVSKSFYASLRPRRDGVYSIFTDSCETAFALTAVFGFLALFVALATLIELLTLLVYYFLQLL